MEKKLDVICLGAAIVDIPLQPVSRDIFDIESYPVDRIAMTVGGDAMNEATIISRLGHKTGIISCVGNDAAGNFILDSCAKDRIDYEGIRVDKTIDTSMNVGLVTADGERTFVTNRNGSLWKTNIEHVDFEKMKQAKILSLASIFNNPLLDGKTLVTIFKEAKKEGMTICADMIKPRLGETLDDIREALSYVDYFFPNFDEACLMTGKTEVEDVAQVLFDCGVKNVIVKIGKRGCYIQNADGCMIVPAAKGITAIDTIGAGDNFASGFISALLDGKDIRECGVYANCTAAVSVQYVGATTGVQNKEMRGNLFNKVNGIQLYKNLNSESVKKEIVGSLERLGTDYVDVYMTHWQAIEGSEYYVPIQITMDVLNDLKAQGKIKAIGAANVDIHHIEEYLKWGDLDIVQAKYSILDRGIEDEIIPCCRENGVTIQAYSPLEMGLLSGTFPRDYKPVGAQIPKKWFQPDNMQAAMDMMDQWKPLCEKYNCTIANLALGWILAQGEFLNLLSGSTTVAEIKENVKSAELELEADDVAYMRELAESIDK